MDLRDHLAVGYTSSRTGRSTSWTFREGDELHAIPMKERVSVNDTEAYVAANALGLAALIEPLGAGSVLGRRQSLIACANDFRYRFRANYFH